MNDLAKMGWVGRLLAWLIAALLFEVMTSATFLWYRDERVYVDQKGSRCDYRFRTGRS